MKKRLSREEKLKQSTVDLINKMFEIAGYPVTYEDIKDRKDDWYTSWMMTTEQNEEWKKWGEEYIVKTFRTPRAIAKKEMEMISLMWGLKFSDFNI